jgi:hypothetical protein
MRTLPVSIGRNGSFLRVSVLYSVSVTTSPR